jgi:fumarate hydratase subunit beta
MTISLTTKELVAEIPRLKAGDRVLLSGAIYTARDAAHQRLSEMIANGKPLPLKLQDAIIYYCGPAPARPGEATGPCGPTTSARMDIFTPQLLSLGVKATIGKGPRSKLVRDALKAYGAVYLVATGGVAALLSRKVRQVELVAFGDLGPEAIYRFEVTDFPLIVAADAQGNDIFAARRAKG